MSLKEELGKLEQEEQEDELTKEEDERLRETEQSIYGLYRRIAIIVEYIDNQTKEETATEEQQQIRAKELELRGLKLDLRIKRYVELLKEHENEQTPGKKEVKEEGQKETVTKGEIGFGLGRAVGDV